MSKVRTAMGRTLDMGALIRRNEKTRAVSNLSVNARGDKIDPFGNVVETANDKAAKHYNGTVGNKSARASASKKSLVPTHDLTTAEKELQEQLDQEEQEIQNLNKR